MGTRALEDLPRVRLVVPGGSTGDREIGADGAPVETLVVAAREDLEIAREVQNMLGR